MIPKIGRFSQTHNGGGALSLRPSLIKSYQDADRLSVCTPYTLLIGEILLFNTRLHGIAVILMNSGLWIQGGHLYKQTSHSSHSVDLWFLLHSAPLSISSNRLFRVHPSQF